MIKNYFKMAFRSISKNGVQTATNIFGISVGMAVVILIVQYTSFEFSFDDFHSKRNEIYRVDSNIVEADVVVSRSKSSGYMLGPTLVEQVPGIATFLRVHPLESGAVVTYVGQGGKSKQQFFEERDVIRFVDQSFFQLFDFKLKEGNRSTLLTEPNSVVITESIQAKYMCSIEEPVGEFIKIDGGRYPGTFKVSGVLEDLPQNSQFSNIQIFLSMKDLLKAKQYAEDDGWGWTNFVTYIMTDGQTDIRDVEKGAVDIINNRDHDAPSDTKTNVVFSSLPDLHLRDKTVIGGINASKLTFFLIIALLIIVIAWLNYINLSTAQAIQRAKEVGIRKVVGATRNQLIFQFFFEVFILNTVGLLLAFGLAYLSLPLLEYVSGRSLVFGSGIELKHRVALGVIFVVGTFLSGLYPSLVLSGFKPAVVIKGTNFYESRKFGLRQGLVVFQLLIAIFLLAGTWAVYRQLQFMRTQDLGLNVEQVLFVRAPFVFEDKEKAKRQMDTFRDWLMTIPAVEEVSTSDALPGGSFNWGTEMIVEGEDEQQRQSVQMMWVDDNFHDTYGIKVVAGRFHHKDLQGVDHQVVVNETLVGQFNLGMPDEAIGKRMKVGKTLFPIIGVVKDYHWNSLKDEKMPTLFYYTDFGKNLSIKMAVDNIDETMASVSNHYRALFPGNPFDYQFMDEYFHRQYQSDEQFGTIFSAFSVIAIVIACLGLFGLASYTLGLRIKEIGIRKILGAKVSSILSLIFKDYLLLIAVASMLGIPILYFMIDEWLSDFAYRINITLDLFAIPVVLLVVITFLTISYQCIRAAIRNPVTTLRCN
ncbi:MAG: ABC transporter permease [Bacteroidota bacterium]